MTSFLWRSVLMCLNGHKELKNRVEGQPTNDGISILIINYHHIIHETTLKAETSKYWSSRHQYPQQYHRVETANYCKKPSLQQNFTHSNNKWERVWTFIIHNKAKVTHIIVSLFDSIYEFCLMQPQSHAQVLSETNRSSNSCSCRKKFKL